MKLDWPRIWRAGRPCVFVLLVLFAGGPSWVWNSPHLLRMPLAVLLILALCLTGTPAWNERLARIGRWWDDLPAAKVLRWTALAGCAIAVFIAEYILEPRPNIADGFAYLFQAKLFAAGHLSLADPHLPAIELPWTIHRHGRIFSQYAPGWPLLLTGGVLLGAPALVNPALAALNFLLLYLLAGELTGDPRRVKLILLFCLLSPFFMFHAGSFLAHNSFLLFSMCAVYCLLRALRVERGLLWFFLSGLASGYAHLIRPGDGAVFWLALALWALFQRRWRALPGIFVSGLGAAVFVALHLYYNQLQTGNWLVTPFSLSGHVNVYGYGRDVGEPEWGDNYYDPSHKPWRSLLNLNYNLAILNCDLFGWPGTGLIFALILLAFGRKTAGSRFALWIIFCVMIYYAGYWYHGVCYGARYYHALLPYLALLTVEGIYATPEVAQEFWGIDAAAAARFTRTLVFVFFAYGLFVYLPYVVCVTPYNYFNLINNKSVEYAREKQLENVLLFIRPGGEQAWTGIIENDLELAKSPVIYASDLGPAENKKLIESFPQRKVVYFKSNTRSGYLQRKLLKRHLLTLGHHGEVSTDPIPPEKAQ